MGQNINSGHWGIKPPPCHKYHPLFLAKLLLLLELDTVICLGIEIILVLPFLLRYFESTIYTFALTF